MSTKEQAISSAKNIIMRGATKQAFIFRVGGAWMFTTSSLEKTQAHYKVKVQDYEEVAFKQSIPKSEQLHIGDEMIDITGTHETGVEIMIRSDSKVLWVNEGGKCRLRICQINGPITIDDQRKGD